MGKPVFQDPEFLIFLSACRGVQIQKFLRNRKAGTLAVAKSKVGSPKSLPDQKNGFQFCWEPAEVVADWQVEEVVLSVARFGNGSNDAMSRWLA